MGLLDQMFSGDPGQQALTATALSLIGAKGKNTGEAFSRAGLLGMGTYNNVLENQSQQKERDYMARYREQQMMQAQAEIEQKQQQAARMASYRATLPPQDQGIFDIAPQEYIKNMPQFQKPQLVEVADPNEPLRTMKQWMRPGDTQGTVAGYGAMPEALDPRIQGAKIRVAEAGRSQNNTNVFNNTKDDFKNERDLRNDFSGLATTKAFNEVQSAHDQIKTAIKTPSPAGDLAAATKIMKILDPGSVVRESELAMAMSATGALDRVQNYAQMVVSGQKLTPAQRKDFGDLSDKLYEAAAERYNASADEYQSVAKDYNLNPVRVAKKAASNTKPVQSTISGGGWSASVVK